MTVWRRRSTLVKVRKQSEEYPNKGGDGNGDEADAPAVEQLAMVRELR